RQAQITGDARQDLVRAARRNGWEMQSFAEIVCGEPPLHRDLVDVCSPFELAVLTRAWRMDFGAPSPRKELRRRPAERHQADREHLQERQHYIGGHSHMYMLDDYVAADEECQNRHDVKVVREAWSDDNRFHREDERPVVVYSDWKDQARSRCTCGATFLPDSRFCRHCGRRRYEQVRYEADGEGSPMSPVKDLERDVRPATDGRREGGRSLAKETLDRPSPRARVDLSDACAVAASYDGTAVYVAGRSGLKRFDLPDLQLTASAPYKGTAEPAGYADVAAGDGFVVCVDLDGCVFRFSKMCELQAKRAYQPSVVKHSQRLVASQLERSAVPVLGLEGGFGGASRLAASSGFVYLGGCDGVVTTYAAGTLSLTSRCRLGTAGIRALFLSAYQRLYCAELSSVHVLALPGMYELARLRGGPRVPVFGSISAVVESSAGDYAFVADVGGPRGSPAI
ncbi:unnamed protein product, partial [Effrenium voratum]